MGFAKLKRTVTIKKIKKRKTSEDLSNDRLFAGYLSNLCIL